MRTIKAVHRAVSAPIADLVTYNALPGESLAFDALNPFIYLNHHGPQVYPPDNNGLPFSPHPHRGIETVTFILEGDIKHRDSGGDDSVINTGGVQWMSAGRGLIHMETCSDEFIKNGGRFEVLQLWLNLPAKYKMKDPSYVGLQKDKIPAININERVKVNLLSGKWDDFEGPFETVTGVSLSVLEMKSGGELLLNILPEENILMYIVKGNVVVNEREADTFDLVEFHHDDPAVKINAYTDALIIFGHSAPLKEPVAAQGPFVMNTEKELIDAYRDYRSGKFGVWKE